MLILFLVLWGLLFGAALFMIAATPTTERTSNAELARPIFSTAVIAGGLTLLVSGVVSLFT